MGLALSRTIAVSCLALSTWLTAGLSCAQTPPPSVKAIVPTTPASDIFSDADRKSVVSYWSAPGRYIVEPSPDFAQRINITVDGSIWYGKFRRLIAAMPKGDPGAASLTSWASLRLAADKAKAGLPKADSVVAVATALTPPPATPAVVQSSIGEPPPLYELVHPQRYTVTFANEDAPVRFVYTDNIAFGNRASYFTSYRQANGVIKMGEKVRDAAGAEKARVDAIFASVGRNDTERHVLQAVSTLEGGFASVNTYDTGYVSVGLIQFIFAKNGDGSLSSVLAQMKADDPSAFAADFHRFGVEVDANGLVDVVPPGTGSEAHGADAVQAIIGDKRLTAVFERAGGHDAFRRAQVLIARKQYWPGDDIVTVTRNSVFEQKNGAEQPTLVGTFIGTPETLPELQAALAKAQESRKADPAYRAWIATDTLSAPVSSFIKSEAGLATLMDRKVNRGNLGSIADVASDIMRTNHLTQMSDLAAFERQILITMKYRADFLADGSLTQPPPSPTASAPPLPQTPTATSN